MFYRQLIERCDTKKAEKTCLTPYSEQACQSRPIDEKLEVCRLLVICRPLDYGSHELHLRYALASLSTFKSPIDLESPSFLSKLTFEISRDTICLKVQIRIKKTQNNYTNNKQIYLISGNDNFVLMQFGCILVAIRTVKDRILNERR